jgi:steroid 5-alpha reductase family enzyme
MNRKLAVAALRQLWSARLGRAIMREIAGRPANPLFVGAN